MAARGLQPCRAPSLARCAAGLPGAVGLLQKLLESCQVGAVRCIRAAVWNVGHWDSSARLGEQQRFRFGNSDRSSGRLVPGQEEEPGRASSGRSEWQRARGCGQGEGRPAAWGCGEQVTERLSANCTALALGMLLQVVCLFVSANQ